MTDGRLLKQRNLLWLQAQYGWKPTIGWNFINVLQHESNHCVPNPWDCSSEPTLDRVQAGSRSQFIRELNLRIGFLYFRGFLLSGMLMSDQRWRSCYTLSDGNHNNNNISHIGWRNASSYVSGISGISYISEYHSLRKTKPYPYHCKRMLRVSNFYRAQKNRDPFRNRLQHCNNTRTTAITRITIHHYSKKEMLPTTSNAHQLTTVTNIPLS